MRLVSFSPKQMKVLCWWTPRSPWRDRAGIICDGAVRSGKTLALGLGFVFWAMTASPGGSFALCGKTIRSMWRNLLVDLLPLLPRLGFSVKIRHSENLVLVSRGGRTGRFYLFGGRDEGSAALIQGMTLGGVLFDEVALMPRSFVEQALARCSAPGAKFWFSCNPEHPGHWFYREWIEQRAQRDMLYLHFSMRDNPSLSPAVLERYRKLFSGVFYRRFVEGRWEASQGLVYPDWKDAVCDAPAAGITQWAVSCDYGTRNPTSFGLWGKKGGCWYRVKESYYDGRAQDRLRTDEEHYRALERLCRGVNVSRVVVDPSALSLIQLIRKKGRFRVTPAKNDVLTGIRQTAAALQTGRVRIDRRCKHAIREFGLYRWDEDTDQDRVLKENDHAMDDIRYFVSTVVEAGRSPGNFCQASPR